MNIKRRPAVLDTLARIGRASCNEIDRQGHLVHGTARAVMRELHKEKRVRICDWTSNPVSGPKYPVWELGTGPDVERPKPRDAAPKSPKRSPFEHPPMPQEGFQFKSIFVGGRNPWGAA